MTIVTIPKQGPNHRTNIYGVTAWNPRGVFHLRVFPVWNHLVNYVRKIGFIHSSSTVYRFNPVSHLLTRSDSHRSILLVHQITEVSQEIIQKLAISIFSVTNMKPALIETEFRSSLSSVSSSELFDFLSFCLPPSLLLCHLFCPLLWEGVRRENRTRVNHLLISGF